MKNVRFCEIFYVLKNVNMAIGQCFRIRSGKVPVYSEIVCE